MHDGFIAGVGLRAQASALKTARGLGGPAEAAPQRPEGMEIVFGPDPTIHDGRFANNGWLQELPKPLTKLTWDNAALLSPATAQKLGLSQTPGTGAASTARQIVDLVELRYAGRAVGPVWILPGHADDSVTRPLRLRPHPGRSRRHTAIGFNAYQLRTSAAPWFGDGLVIHEDRRALYAGLHPDAPCDGRPRPGP